MYAIETMGHQSTFCGREEGVIKPLYAHMKCTFIITWLAVQKLDVDDTPLVDRHGATMARDIVQLNIHGRYI